MQKDNDIFLKALQLLERAKDIASQFDCTMTEAVGVVTAAKSEDNEIIQAYAKLYFPSKKQEETAERIRKAKLQTYGPVTARQHGKSHMADALSYGNMQKMADYQNQLLQTMIDKSLLEVSPSILINPPVNPPDSLTKKKIMDAIYNPTLLDKLTGKSKS